MGSVPIFLRVALPFLAGYFVSYLYRMVNAVLGPTLAAEFGLTAGGLGLLSSVYFLAFALFQLPLGLLLDRFGPRRVNAILLLVAALGGLWFSLATSAESAIAARALIGFGVSGCLMAAFTAFVLWYPPERISTLNALAFSVGCLGAIVATVPVELLLRAWPWRQVFQLIVAVTVVVALALWLVVPERARGRAESLGEQVRSVAALFRDGAFLRIAVCLGASQCAAVALQTLWVATWLRDVNGYSPAEVARGLLAISIAMIVGYLGFGRAADRLARSGRSALPLLIGGVAVASLALLLLMFGVRGLAAMAVWCVFVAAATSVVLGYSILSRRLPKEMAGRANTAINQLGFIGMFSGQWLFGLVLDFWPQTPSGYAPEAYPWALGLLWVVQAAGLAWLWRGRAAVEHAPRAATGGRCA
ncbi:MAG TPA: MFS transporter [Burkholderiales bacterium]|nr:MFS transporter [Burkholderiales bacterium]